MVRAGYAFHRPDLSEHRSPLPYGQRGKPLCKAPPGQPIRRYTYNPEPSLPPLPPLPNDAFLLNRDLSFSDDNEADHDPYELWKIDGKLRWNRVERIWEATGSFVDAKAEGGLQYGGCSTGRVKWKVDNSAAVGKRAARGGAGP